MSDVVQSAKNLNKERWAWMWIFYTGFTFIQPLVDPTLRCWVVTLVALVLFLGLYTAYLRSENWHPVWRYVIVGLVYLLGMTLFPFNNGASTYLIYAASFIAFLIHDKRIVVGFFFFETLSVLVLHYVLRNSGPEWSINWPNTIIAIFLIFLIGGGNIFYAEQKRADCQLRMANEEIEALAAVAERERIARDLHDVLGHTLSLIVLKAELAKRLIATDPQRAGGEMADVENAARTALAEVREAIGGYRTRGLAAEIERARHTLDAATITLHAEISAADTAKLTAGEESVLSLALREAVTNIVRHAKATECRLRFVHQNGHRRLLVEDNGSHPLVREGNGLRGMRERVESVGGTLRVERDHGTRLLIELPAST